MNEFVDYLHDVFKSFGAIRARRMFGGYGIYHQDLMFALVVDDVLYLKADSVSATRFEQRGLSRFTYMRKGKPQSLGFYQAPEEIYDDPDSARQWAQLAFDAAVASASRNKKK